MNNSKISKCCLALLCLCLPIQFVAAQDVEWPCVQVLVPTVELAVMWPEPVEPAVFDDWLKNKEVAALARHLSDLDEYTDQDSSMVGDFASGIAESEAIEQLNLLAAGTLTLFNERRTFYIQGIRKYTRQQNAMALQVEDGLNKLEAFGEDNTSKEAMEIEETVRWHQRIFDQREQAIRLLCEQPVILEQTLSAIVRDISQYLP